MKIGVISDTHGYLDDKVFNYFNECDEIWHAGDIGDFSVIDSLERFKPTIAVYGNIDSRKLRITYPEHQNLEREGLTLWMTHIGGYPPRYNPEIKPEIRNSKPDIFVCGHSHILRVMHDPQQKQTLYINPGAAGKHGFHKIRTIVRFEIVDKKIFNMQAIELGKRA
jgi:hypothetical protein